VFRPEQRNKPPPAIMRLRQHPEGIGPRLKPEDKLMNKSLFAIATAALAVTTLFTSAAEAGFKIRLGFGGPLPAFTAYSNSGYYGRKLCKKRSHQIVRREEKAPARVAKKSGGSTSVAKVEEKPETTDQTAAAEQENSSISVAEAVVAENKSAEPVKTAAATSEPVASPKIDCKKFFASVGMTLSVPCE
jgi:hypothetical protein